MSDVWDDESKKYVSEEELEKRKARRKALEGMGLRSDKAEKTQDGARKQTRSWSIFDKVKGNG